MLTQKITLVVDCQRFVYYSNFIEKNDIWHENDFQKCVQTGDDLGERMKNAFAEVLKTQQKAVIIGSDCAELNAEIINDAFAKLDSHDFVVGPAQDGGYYLLGMRTFQPSVFDNIEWSSDSVFAATISAIQTLNKSVALLPILNDLDNEADWENAKHLL